MHLLIESWAMVRSSRARGPRPCHHERQLLIKRKTTMSEDNTRLTSRREFLKGTGRIAAVSALAGTAIPHVHASENNTIQIALIGCGGRGTGAAQNALSVNNGPVKLVAMGDVFENR